MATYQVEVRPAAAKSLKRLPQDVQHRIRACLRALALDPRAPGCIKLKGYDGYRRRVGDYRILYFIFDDVLIVSVIDIAHRKDVYRQP